MTFLESLHRVVDRGDLSCAQAEAAMREVLSGGVSQSLLTAFLVALRMKGELAEEMLGFARAMRNAAEPVPVAGPLLDTCGTGGDGCNTFNISTVTAFVVAACGVRIAKHGNRSLSSQCGSADLLEELGVTIDLSPAAAARCIDEVGIGFLYAPRLHPAMKHAQPARRELKLRTFFNLLGPLTNPAHATAQLVGAPSRSAAALMAQVLAGLGGVNALVVHGLDGLDEVTTTAPTICFQVRAGHVHESQLSPADFGLPPSRAADLKGGDRATNARIARSVLHNEPSPARDIVLANAAAALVVAGAAPDWPEGVQRAAAALSSGAAWAKLSALAELTSQLPSA